MCGRVRLSSDVSEIKLVFSIPPHRSTPNFPPSWNVAPTDPLPIVRHDPKAGERSLDVMRWGLVPYWAKDLKVGFANINAKAEGIKNRPAFREAFQRRRCLVPSITFTSGRRPRPASNPIRFALADRGMMALAGLWKIGTRQQLNGSGASLSLPVRPTSYAPNCTTACRWSLALRHGRHGSGKSLRMPASSRRYLSLTHRRR